MINKDGVLEAEKLEARGADQLGRRCTLGSSSGENRDGDAGEDIAVGESLY